MLNLDELDFDKGGGLITVVTQDALTGCVLMLAHADRDALVRTQTSGEMHYFSRTRGPWHKGASSGNKQVVLSLHADCDGDAVLALVRPAGPACHNNTASCFPTQGPTLPALSNCIEQRKREPMHGSYTSKLMADRNLRLKKLGEETAELVTALCDADRERIAEEAADVFYHVLVAASAADVSLENILQVLRGRQR